MGNTPLSHMVDTKNESKMSQRERVKGSLTNEWLATGFL